MAGGPASYRPISATKPAEGRPSRCGMLALLLTVLASPIAAAEDAATSGGTNPRVAALADEARQTIAVIDWFYVQHRTCPQPSRPSELSALEGGLGDGFTVDREGPFFAIRGISMSALWRYYASPDHADRCSLLRELASEAALIWRRRGGSAGWAFVPGDGSGERPIRLAP